MFEYQQWRRRKEDVGNLCFERRDFRGNRLKKNVVYIRSKGGFVPIKPAKTVRNARRSD